MKLSTISMDNNSTEVRDEKIARIIKEFREEFVVQIAPTGIYAVQEVAEDIEAWLTQTLTTLLDEK